MNEDESEIACAKRETLEETGLKVDITNQTPKVSINHNVYFILILQYHHKLKIIDRHEVDKINWMTISEIRKLECNKDLRSILQYPERKFVFHNTLIDLLKLDYPLANTTIATTIATTSDESSSSSETSETERVGVAADAELALTDQISYGYPPGLQLPTFSPIISYEYSSFALVPTMI